MVMNQVTLCVQNPSMMSVWSTHVLFLLKDRGYHTEVLLLETRTHHQRGRRCPVIRLKLDSLKEALLATKTKTLLPSLRISKSWLLFRLEEIGFLKEHKIRILGTSLRQYRTFTTRQTKSHFLAIGLGLSSSSSSLVSTVRRGY